MSPISILPVSEARNRTISNIKSFWNTLIEDNTHIGHVTHYIQSPRHVFVLKIAHPMHSIDNIAEAKTDLGHAKNRTRPPGVGTKIPECCVLPCPLSVLKGRMIVQNRGVYF
jgi:hypothetical protein